MSDWLRPVEDLLDAAGTPVEFFFRDDDAGWDDGRLEALLARFERAGVPIDLAVIPVALGARMADELARRAGGRPGMLGLHQHGYAHGNHEPAGRKCEFGPARDYAMQARDLGDGARLLAERLGDRLDPIFTPPWNRCSSDTAAGLRALGFRALSRDRGAAPIDAAGLIEIPVAVDWCKRVDDRPQSPEAIASRIAAEARAASPIGIMLHHAAMDDDSLDRVGELLMLLARHPAARCRLMREFCGAA